MTQEKINVIDNMDCELIRGNRENSISQLLILSTGWSNLKRGMTII